MTIIDNPSSPRVQAIFLKAHLKLFAKGMRHSRLSGKDILAKASAITGNAYKRGQYTIALAELEALTEQL